MAQTQITGDNLVSTTVTAAHLNADVFSTDRAWTGSQRSTLVTDNDGSFAQKAGQKYKCTPAANLTLTFTNHTSGQSGYIILINSGGKTISLHGTSKADANIEDHLDTSEFSLQGLGNLHNIN